MERMFLSKLTISGPDKKDACLSFKKGLNVITGDSDTGKTYAFQCIDYMLGKDSQPKNIVEAQGYTLITLELYIGNEKYILQRNIGENKIKVLFENKELNLSCKHNANNDNNLSKFLLNKLLGKTDNIIINSKKGENRTLSFRDIVHLCLVSETDIIAESSAFQSIQYVEKTARCSVLKYVITQEDDSKATQESNRKNEIISRQGVVLYLKDKKNEIEQSIQKIKEDTRFKLLIKDGSLQSATQSIQSYRESISNLNDILSEKTKELDELNKLCLGDSAKTKEFTSLKEYYAEELQKLQVISCYQDFVSQLPHIACPFCKQTIEPKALNDSDMEILYTIWNTNKEELLKKQEEISCSILDIENRLHENLLKRENLQQEIRCLENTIDKKQEELILFNDSMAKMRELDEMRYNLESLNKQLQSIITNIEEYSKIDNIKKENLSIAINKEKYDNYCSVILKTLTDWGFPNISELHFDAKTLDLSINSKSRKTLGKGYRAFIMAAMTISLMRYCINNDYMHPGFVIIDSPLVSLKERKITNASEYIDSYMEQKMIENIVETDVQNQVIIFENKDLKFNLEYSYVEFYHDSDIKGFIPKE